jgi:hypothetical protein
MPRRHVVPQDTAEATSAASFPRTCVALYDYEPPRSPDAAERLPLRSGDTVQLLGPCRKDGLVPVELYGARGLVPFRYLEPIANTVPRSRLLAQLGQHGLHNAAPPPSQHEPFVADHAGATIYRAAWYAPIFPMYF